VYSNIIAQYEAEVQELQKVMDTLQKRLKVCMPADMDWNPRTMNMKIIAPF
jgi:hypothetical protein